MVGESLSVPISHEAYGSQETYSGLQRPSGTEMGLRPGLLSLGSVLFQSIDYLINHLGALELK